MPLGTERGRAAMLLIVTGDQRLLLHLRDDKPGIPHPGCWSGFGGAVEDGESVVDAVRREVFEETGLRIAQPVFLTEEVDAEGDGRLVSLFYVLGDIAPDDIDLREGAGVGVHGFGELDGLPVAPFVYRAIRSHLVPALGAGTGHLRWPDVIAVAARTRRRCRRAAGDVGRGGAEPRPAGRHPAGA